MEPAAIDGSEPVLAITGVTKTFGAKAALAGLDLTLAPGQVYALLGPNGAGKTTTINLILGFLRASRGTVHICGRDVAADPVAARRLIAYIPEQVALYPHLSGMDNMRYFTTLAGLDLDEPTMAGLLRDAGLQEDAHSRRGGDYSKGMRQKVGIAIAVARHARLLLLDEPTSGLDPSAAADFSAVVRRAAGEGTSVLMATHDLYRIKEMADRVGILSHGAIRRELDPATLDHVDLERLYIKELAA